MVVYTDKKGIKHLYKKNAKIKDTVLISDDVTHAVEFKYWAGNSYVSMKSEFESKKEAEKVFSEIESLNEGASKFSDSAGRVHLFTPSDEVKDVQLQGARVAVYYLDGGQFVHNAYDFTGSTPTKEEAKKIAENKLAQEEVDNNRAEAVFNAIAGGVEDEPDAEEEAVEEKAKTPRKKAK